MFSAINIFLPNCSMNEKFEKQFNYIKSPKWMINNRHTAFYWIALYMILVFGGQSFMANRQKYKLKLLLIVWDLLLGVFSTICMIKISPELSNVLTYSDFSNSVSLNIIDINNIFRYFRYVILIFIMFKQ